MLYINEDNVNELGTEWSKTINVIEDAVSSLGKKKYAQPVKPYLRYGEAKNRIIAMPAYLGGNCNKAGIKWIASFPDNINKNIPRANSVVILNKADTGEVESIINTSLISVIRTASVSGFMIKSVLKCKDLKNIKVGIIGFGPIGQYHLKMCKDILKDRVENYYLYDIRPISDIEQYKEYGHDIKITDSWQEVYKNCDIVICCTVSAEPYIDCKPKDGALILNVSLRDFKLESYKYLNKNIIIDDWDEVCRENTTIHDWNKAYGLKEKDTHTLVDVLNNNYISQVQSDCNIFFCPMGMAVFDIAIATYYYNMGLNKGIGTQLK